MGLNYQNLTCKLTLLCSLKRAKLVQTLMDIYQSKTGDKTAAHHQEGRTYCKNDAKTCLLLEPAFSVQRKG